MVEKRESGLQKTSTCSIKEQAAQATLRNVRSKGHTYVDLRKDGKNFVFFCTLCLSRCYGDSALFAHLKGNLHKVRYAGAKVTLMGPNPWPFNDGALFFGEQFSPISNGSQNLLLANHDEQSSPVSNGSQNLLLANHDEQSSPVSNGSQKMLLDDHDNDNSLALKPSDSDKKLISNDVSNGDLVIPEVRFMDVISNLGVRFEGLGKISAKLLECNGVSSGIKKIWCEWLGKMNVDDEDTFEVPKHDFAIVTFTYTCDLGRKGLLDDVRSLLSSSEIENGRKRRAFSDPEDMSGSLSDSSGGETLASYSRALSLTLLSDGDLLNTRFISSKTARRELRRHQRIAAERMCDICQHKVLIGKDVSTLLNLKTGRLACNSRNGNGLFHMFHTSCLIHWVLFSEFKLFTNQFATVKVPRRSKRRKVVNQSGMGNEIVVAGTQSNSLFCPECQGTGLYTEGCKVEKPSINLSELFKCKIKISDAHKAWMRNPEVLPNCSTGFEFSSQSEETIQGKASPLKLVKFYRADYYRDLEAEQNK